MPTLATSRDAAEAFAPIRSIWLEREETRYARLQPMLEDFLRRYPRDGLAPLATVELAITYMQLGDVPRAEALLRNVEKLPAGTTRDLFTIARARLFRLHRQPQSGLDLLRPLAGKVVGAGARELFVEEITLSALDAGLYYEAIGYMDAWLRGVIEADRERARRDVKQALARVPRHVLEAAYRTMRAPRGESAGYSLEIQRMLATRLGEVALEQGDTTLARWILEPTPNVPLPSTDVATGLGELATSRRGLVSVRGRTVGLILPAGSPQYRQEAADVLRGVAWALELPRMNPEAGDGVRLVTRSDGSDPKQTDAALEELAGEGASVVIAGIQEETAVRALAWGERRGLAVMVFSPPPGGGRAGLHGFVLGEPRQRQYALLVERLGLGNERAIAIGDTAGLQYVDNTRDAMLPMDVCAQEAPLGERFPVGAWAKMSSKWILVGSSECGRDLLRASPPRNLTLALPLESASLAADAPGFRILALNAGSNPLVDVPREPDVIAYMDQFGARPNWWTALGRDAGVLARKAVASLPLDATDAPNTVALRRTQVEANLLRIRTKLWTTDSTGFDAARYLPRVLSVVAIPPGKRR